MTYQSPAIESFIFVRYCPGPISVASANTGAMPGCDMFPSNLMRAPAIGSFDEASFILIVIVTSPTRAGSGKTSYEMVRFDVAGTFGRPQPCTSASQTQSATRKKLFRSTTQVATAGTDSCRSEQVHAATSSPLGGNM